MGISGIELCRRFYTEVVGPQLRVPHSAGLLGRGSEVLGFDDEMSTDHNCEARVVLFVAEPAAVGLEVPGEFLGRPALVEPYTREEFFVEQLGFDPAAGMRVEDWFTVPEQHLGILTAGAMFHDELGVQAVRDRLAYYPDDVWRYLLISAWWRVHPELNHVGRTGYVGDELGSGLVAARLVEGLMRVCFLIERQYAPYAKWFGTAFARLSCGPALAPLLQAVLRTGNWQDREQALLVAYRAVGELFNRSGITAPVELGLERMFGRPFPTAWGDFPGALSGTISDPEVQAILRRWPVGGVDRIRDQLWKPVDRRRVTTYLDDVIRTGS
ncbi:DUF4037 domain-containing protein [Kribbella sandramycini]|uniref:Catechol 2,3-dioxygenase-like lactoylglutathione lyase family enzyme n=1 Tax=Kribbella sandramycini TaxID=60450 RepID=A0A7Y4L6R7_9ACTN|nr:DUF4037 domain-containing protein [Kribbella sandramycini]MBB6570094.1 catechol 2,3-dioxygenase-like lactoylglutathione lyase family enzyme [Kribbella sandramycini]NOL45404.1 DUF4037 domain-containing protein [Kribbella sandramycini]